MVAEKGAIVAGAVGSTALDSHFGVSLEERDPTSGYCGQAESCPIRWRAEGAPLSHAKAAPAQSRTTDLGVQASPLFSPAPVHVGFYASLHA